MGVILLSAILACRFFSIFVVMPLIVLYVLSFEDANSTYIGLAIGAYAFSQIIFQLPFGFLSDKWGRKPLIYIGIVIFIIGSLICAFSSSAFMLVMGRFLQGVSAIGGVISAMIADIVPEQKRTKAMAIMGASISLSFTIAMIIGSSFGASFGVHQLFILSAFLSAVSLVLLFMVPKIPKIDFIYSTSKEDNTFFNKNLALMNLTNFLQKFLMSLAFVFIPMIMVKNFGMPKESLWQVFVPASILGVLSMAPSAILAEKKGFFKQMLCVGILAFIIAYICMLKSHYELLFILGAFLFFVGFSIHEPIMQSLASRYCKTYQKGKALGVFTTYGYLGSFCGGLAGGHFYEWISGTYVVWIIVIVCVLWIFLLYFLDSPHKLYNLYIDFKEENIHKLNNLQHLQGINEWYINKHEKKLVVRYNTNIINENTILERLQ